MPYLSDKHRKHLHSSALDDVAIDRMEFRTEDDPVANSRLLGWNRPAKQLGSCLVIPFFHADGSRNGYARIRPDRPRPDGGKYESPRGAGNRAYFPPGAVEAIAKPRVPVLVTEGEKKALAADQTARRACIGLTGCWNWQLPREKDEKGHGKGERRLIPDLAGIDWRDRPVGIIPDADPTRKEPVSHGFVELARVLTDHGALVRMIDLPTGPRDADGLPGKLGVDDFIMLRDPEPFQQIVDAAMADASPVRPLGEWRESMQVSRVQSVDRPAPYLDRSPPGSGKSHVDRPPARIVGRSLIVQPTHENCRDVEADFRRDDLLAVAYPELSPVTCANHEEAIAAIAAGLPASSSVCSSCLFFDCCDYQVSMDEADAAAHRIATHQRGVYALEHLTK